MRAAFGAIGRSGGSSRHFLQRPEHRNSRGREAVLHTTDGGATWIPQVSGTTDVLEGVAFTDVNTGTAVGGSFWPVFEPVILHTIDGGQTWTRQFSDPDYLLGVSFVDANTGWAVGYFGTILHTTGGGTTWTRQSCGAPGWLYGIFFTDANNGTAAGAVLKLAGSTDRYTLRRLGTQNGNPGKSQCSGVPAWLHIRCNDSRSSSTN